MHQLPWTCVFDKQKIIFVPVTGRPGQSAAKVFSQQSLPLSPPSTSHFLSLYPVSSSQALLGQIPGQGVDTLGSL